jgi:hypothetical protein
MQIKTSYAVVQYNKFMKGIDQADQCLSCYSVLWKTVKGQKSGTVSAKLCAQCIFCVQDIKYKQNKAQELPVPGRKFLEIRSPGSK